MDNVGNIAIPSQPGATKLRILALLRRGPHTVPELATELSLTSNAVRTHLATLERDRLVAPHGHRPTARRPATMYKLTPLADQLLTKPYAAVLSAVLQTVKERYGDSELTGLLREIGQRLGQERAARVLGLAGRARVETIAEVINDLGGVVEVEEQSSRFILTGYSCPLVAVVAAHAPVCALTQALIETLLGQGRVQECCDRHGEIRCRFAIDLGA
ncbi:MAG TPA: ArsR family transcriptional regulator [Chloroflexota bacterium]|nr:ArsR family transcriptional regulator [Chloroflexota bacterium]